MSDRLTRGDRRTGAHDDKETQRRSGPVKTLTPEEIAAMEPNKPTNRIDVAALDEKRRLADLKLLLSEREPKEQSWDQLAADGLIIATREMAFCKAASDAAQIAGGQMSDAQWERYRETMAVIKQNRVEERQAGGNNSDPDDIAALQRAAKKAG